MKHLIQSLKVNQISSFQFFQVLKYSGQILINIALAKTYLPTAEIGKFESFLFIASSVSFFWVTGIMQYLLSAYPNSLKNSNKNSSTLFFSGFLLIIIISLLTLIFASIFVSNKTTSFTTLQKSLLLFYLLINPISFLAEYILLLKKKSNVLIKFGIITFIVPSLLISTPAFLGYEVTFSFYGLLIWAIIKLFYVSHIVNRNSILKINKKEISHLFIKSLPLIGTALLVGSASYIDGFIIKGKFDDETFAIFRYGAKEFPLFLIVASSFSNSMVPLIAEKGNLSNALLQIKESSKRMMHWFFPIAILFLITSHYLFPLVFNPDFKESYKVFDIYLLLIISRFVFPQSILMGLGKHKTILWVSICELIINIVSSLLLIQYFGILGVAYGTVVAYFFEKVALIISVKKMFKVNLKEYIASKKLIIYTFVILTIFWLKLYFVK